MTVTAAGGRLPEEVHRSRPWLIHDIDHDLGFVDAWALPTPGGPDDFPRLVEMVAGLDPSRSSSPIVRMLFAARFAIGGLLGWDELGAGPPVTSLRDRLPPGLDSRLEPPAVAMGGFTTVYLLDREWAAEISNRTVHGVLHLGWVSGPEGVFNGELAVYAKPHGLLGSAYLAGIAPFRHLIVYPQLLREFRLAWQALGDGAHAP